MSLNESLAALSAIHARQLDSLVNQYDAEIGRVYREATERGGESGLHSLHAGLTSTVQAARVVATTMAVQHLHDELREAIGPSAGFIALDMAAHPHQRDVSEYVDKAVEEARSKIDDIGSTAYRGETIVESEAVRAYDDGRKAAERTLSNLSDEQALRHGFQVARGEVRSFSELLTRRGAPLIPILGKRWSALNDKQTCTTCQGKDGQLTVLALDFSNESPPVHARCRCVTHLWAVGWADGNRTMPVENQIVARLDVALDTRAEDFGERVIRNCIASDESLDSHGTTIKADGWVLDRFKTNPVLIWAHSTCGGPDDVIGTADVRVEGARLMADLNFPTKGLNPKADMVFEQMRAKIIRGLSVGFRPREYHYEEENTKNERIVITSAELVELSVVPVPSNPNTLAASIRSMRAADTAPKEIVEMAVETQMVLPPQIASLLSVDSIEGAARVISELQLGKDNAVKAAADATARADAAETEVRDHRESVVAAEVDAMISAGRIMPDRRESALTLARSSIAAFRDMFPAETAVPAIKPASLSQRITPADKNPEPKRPVDTGAAEMRAKIQALLKSGLSFEEAHTRALTDALTGK